MWALHLTFFSLHPSALDGICCDKHKSTYLAKYQAVSVKKFVDMHVAVYVRHTLFYLILTKTVISQQILAEFPNIKYFKNRATFFEYFYA
jgi:hypothetical protein